MALIGLLPALTPRALMMSATLTPPDLSALIAEADRLLAQREGVHEMHGAAGIVRGFCPPAA